MCSKPKFILEKEKEFGIFSIMKFPLIEGKFIHFLKTKKLKNVYQESQMSDQGIIKEEKVIYETLQKFYLLIEDTPEEDKWQMTIYYNPDQYDELRLFANQLNKQYKNGTVNT